jgi:hypothetical protein
MNRVYEVTVSNKDYKDFVGFRDIVNLSKPSGNFTYHPVDIKKFCMVPTLRLCVLYGCQNKQQLLPYNTLRDWFL